MEIHRLALISMGFRFTPPTLLSIAQTSPQTAYSLNDLLPLFESPPCAGGPHHSAAEDRMSPLSCPLCPLRRRTERIVRQAWQLDRNNSGASASLARDFGRELSRRPLPNHRSLSVSVNWRSCLPSCREERFTDTAKERCWAQPGGRRPLATGTSDASPDTHSDTNL